jgi:vancomycin resistance protein YoaR
MITGGVIALLVVVYVADLLTSVGDIPRGTTVVGIDVGGLTQAKAEAKLRVELEPRLTQPVAITAGDVQTTLSPAVSGLGLDWPGTLGRAGHQPLSPITRVMSFFATREVGVVTKIDSTQVDQAVNDLAGRRLNHTAVEGSIGFGELPGTEGAVSPYAIEPRQGQVVKDVGAAVSAITAGWLNPGGVTLQVDVTPVKATSSGVHGALDQIVVPAVAKPIVVHGDGKDALLTPVDIARSFQFAPLDDGALEVRIDQRQLQLAVQPDLISTETESKDAQIVFTNDQPAVQPSVDSKKINWANTFLPLTDVLKRADGRDLSAVYDKTRPNITSEAASALGIKEVVSEYTTTGFSADVATNVQALAAKVSGAIVRPGQTFSLDTRSGPRTLAQGFVPASVNEDGTGPLVIGGGTSQFATTLYNAVYLAGLKDVDHATHDSYFNRYPPARDVKAMETSGTGVDLKFADDAPTGIAIQAVAAGDLVTIRIWGTKRYRVESIPGPQTNVKDAPRQVGIPGRCRPSQGTPGFTISDTRVLYDIGTGKEVRRETRTVTYRPTPTVICP